MAWSDPYPLSAARRVKLVSRTKLNDVFLAVAAGTLRRYLQRRGIRNPYDILVSMPVDMRGRESRLKMGARCTMVDVTLPTSTEGSIPRLWEVRQRMLELKTSADTIVLYAAQWFLTRTFPHAIYRHLWRSLLNRGTAFISNVHGPAKKSSLDTKEVNALLPIFHTFSNVFFIVNTSTYKAVRINASHFPFLFHNNCRTSRSH